jgi:hypothetical protein
VSNQAVSESRYRTEAAALADEYIARLLVAKPAELATDYSQGQTKFNDWLSGRVKAIGSGLPGGGATMTPSPLPAEADLPAEVKLVVTWRAPGATEDSQHIVATSIYAR